MSIRIDGPSLINLNLLHPFNLNVVLSVCGRQRIWTLHNH